MNRIGLVLLAALALVLVAAAAGLSCAHRGIRRVDPPLPLAEDVVAAGAAAAGGDLPVRLSWLDSANQAMPRARVLERRRDPWPGGSFVMAFPTFVLEWSDGRGLLIDAGMDEKTARRFGAPLEWLGADPLVFEGALADRLGAATRRPWALLLTHLHEDHTQGAQGLCAARRPEDPAIPLFQGPEQATLRNYTTRHAAAQLESARCVEPRRLESAALARVPGFGGVFVLRAGGHTPDSQVVVAFLREKAGVRGFVFTGDVANHVEGIRSDVPKPFLYQTLVVPEWDERLGRLRRLLRELERRGFALVVSHDRSHLETLGLPAWTPPAGQRERNARTRFAPLASLRYPPGA